MKGDQSGMRDVGLLAPELVVVLDAQTNVVRISGLYARKNLNKPNVEWADFALMPQVLQYGGAFGDKDRHMTFIYEHQSNLDVPKYWKLTIKTDAKRTALFVATFHRVGIDDVRRRRRLWPLLREQAKR